MRVSDATFTHISPLKYRMSVMDLTNLLSFDIQIVIPVTIFFLLQLNKKNLYTISWVQERKLIFFVLFSAFNCYRNLCL